LAQQFSNLRILIVEPEREMRFTLAGIMRSLGVGSIKAVSGVGRAIEALKQDGSEVVVCADQLPKSSGIALAKAVRCGADIPDKKIGFILTSFAPDLDLVVGARDAGIDTILAKPVSVQALGARLAAVQNAKLAFIEADSYVGPDRRRQQKPFKGADRRQSAVAAAPQYEFAAAAYLQVDAKGRPLARTVSGPGVLRPKSPQPDRQAPAKPQGWPYEIGDLRPGMVAIEPVQGKTGITIVGAGTELTERMIYRLTDMAALREIGDTVMIAAE
jgi:two-component system chemotaxis response regulator CheY